MKKQMYGDYIVNHPVNDEVLQEQFEDEQTSEWDMAKSQIQQFVDEFGLNQIQWFINSLKPKRNVFTFGYDDNAHLIQHRNDEI